VKQSDVRISDESLAPSKFVTSTHASLQLTMTNSVSYIYTYICPVKPVFRQHWARPPLGHRK